MDAMHFLPHVPQPECPAGALAAAAFIASGARGMERGPVPMDRDEQDREVPADLELLRLAVPRRVYTVSHYKYVADRLHWLYQHRDLIGGLSFIEEPPVLRFFAGLMAPTKSNWGAALVEAFEKDFGTEC